MATRIPSPTAQTIPEGVHTLLGLACNLDLAMVRAWAAAGWLQVRNKNGQTALDLAACIGHARGVQALLDEGADPDWIDPKDNQGFSSLHIGTLAAPPHTFAMLVAASRHLDAPTFRGLSALGLACLHTRERHAHILIKAGASLDPAAPGASSPRDLGDMEMHELIDATAALREAQALGQTVSKPGHDGVGCRRL